MIRMILARLVGAVVVVFFVATFGFLALRAAPGSPFDQEKSRPPAVERNLRQRYGLDLPLWKQYRNYMLGLLRGDLGPSQKREDKTVNEIIAENFPRSLKLGLFALAFATLFGVGLGVVAAARQHQWPEYAAMSLALLGISVPSFVLAPLLIQWFSLKLGWLPPARMEGIHSLILPALALGLIFMGVIARLTRTGMVETIRQDYVRTARAKGLGEVTVIGKHALRLGILPVVTYLGPATASLITGSFVVERIFQVPGLGRYFVGSVVERDYTTLTGVMVFYCLFLVLLNLLVDIVYGILDPRIRSRAREAT
jgi:oligopeptide transport system permease protein